MRYKLLGRSGLRVAELALGTMTFGGDDGLWNWGVDEATSREILDAYVEAGGNCLDTADMYTDGRAEVIAGRWLKEHGDRPAWVVATKYTNRNLVADYPKEAAGAHANASGNHRKNLVQSVEASLRRLETDYIDLLWVHSPDYMTPLEEMLRALDDLVRQGKVLHVGLSDFPAWMVARADALADARGWTRPTAIQLYYSLIERTPERELVPMAKALDIAIMSWSPLSGGLLTGKYAERDVVSEDGSMPEDAEVGAAGTPSNGDARRMDLTGQGHSYVVTERSVQIAREVEAVAKAIGATPAQVALRWLMDLGVVPIVGATSRAQIEENLGATEVTLTSEHTTRLNGASKIDMGFPHLFLDTCTGLTYGGFFSRIDRPAPERSGDALLASPGYGRTRAGG